MVGAQRSIGHDEDDAPEVSRRVLYIRTDGELAERIEKITAIMRKRTREKVSAASIARRLLWAALESPKARRLAGIG